MAPSKGGCENIQKACSILREKTYHTVFKLHTVKNRELSQQHMLFHFVFQFRSCIKKMVGMSGGDDEESSTSQSVTEVSKVAPA